MLGMFFGAGPPVFCFLTTLVIASIFFGTKIIGPWTLWSLVPAVIVDIVFLKKWVRRAYQINNKALAIVYLFYSVVALGMGMGVPILNFVLGIIAGIYAAKKMHFIEADKQSRNHQFKKMSVFTAAVMALMCCLITLWAIAGQMIGYRFETPVLSFTFTVPIFWMVVVAGGAFLVLLQYGLTIIAARIAFRLQLAFRSSALTQSTQ
jgi:hypothetical protein